MSKLPHTVGQTRKPDIDKHSQQHHWKVASVRLPSQEQASLPCATPQQCERWKGGREAHGGAQSKERELKENKTKRGERCSNTSTTERGRKSTRGKSARRAHTLHHCVLCLAVWRDPCHSSACSSNKRRPRAHKQKKNQVWRGRQYRPGTGPV